MIDLNIKKSFRDKVQKAFTDPIYFVYEFLEEEMHEDQKKAMRLIHNKDESALVCGNRWGKGDLLKHYFAYLAAFKPVEKKFADRKLNMLNTSISQDQANIIFDKFCDTLLDKPKFSWLIKDYKKSPFPHIIFKTDVTLWFRNSSQDGKFLEGRSYFFANFDEADLQRDFKWFINEILSPRLWDFGGQLCWTTTPRRGKKNAYKLWDTMNSQIKAGNKKIVTFRGDSRNNTFLSEKAIEKMNALPERLLNKNVKGIFEDSYGEITQESLDFCELQSAGMLSEPIAGCKYINTWDFARSHTFNVGVTIEVSDPLQLRSIERKQDPGKRNKLYWQHVCMRVRDRGSKWKGVTGIDATGIGDVLSSFLCDTAHIPFNFGKGQGALRDEIVDTGVAAIQCGEIGLPLSDPRLNIVTNGELWSARDELSDFDRNTLDTLIWDFACALFMGIYLAKGKRGKVNSKSKIIPSISVPAITGAPKYAMA